MIDSLHSIRLVNSFAGIDLIESDLLVDGPFEDWSEVRSPGRARRRRRRGYRQRIRLYYRPSENLVQLPDGSLVGHPQTLARLRAMIGAEISRKADQIFTDAILGPVRHA